MAPACGLIRNGLHNRPARRKRLQSTIRIPEKPADGTENGDERNGLTNREKTGNGRKRGKSQKQARHSPKRKRGLGEAAYGVFDRFRFPEKPSIKSPQIHFNPDTSFFSSVFCPVFTKTPTPPGSFLTGQKSGQKIRDGFPKTGHPFPVPVSFSLASPGEKTCKQVRFKSFPQIPSFYVGNRYNHIKSV